MGPIVIRVDTRHIRRSLKTVTDPGEAKAAMTPYGIWDYTWYPLQLVHHLKVAYYYSRRNWWGQWPYTTLD